MTFLRTSLALACTLLASCHAPLTQVIVVVESDLPPADIARVLVEVTSSERSESLDLRVVGTGPSAGETTLPFSFGLRARPGREAERPRVRVSALGADGSVLVRALATVPFVAGETRRAIVRLEDACRASFGACEGGDRTCRAGRCAAVALEASELARVAPGDELVGLPPFERPDGGASCSPECAPDEACIAGTCRCGEGAGCGEGALCDEGACVPWPRSCDAVGRGVGCDVIDIPGGTFAMGSEDAYASGATGAFPVQPSITVGALRVDAYEVTVARFRRFWEAGHPAATSVRYPDGTTLPGGVVAEPLGVGTFECNWSAEPGARELHPVNCVEHAAALAFCAWDGGRLPTEAEWEWIARGRSVGEHAPGRVYPWGDVPQPEGTEGGACTLAQAFGCAGEDGAATRRVGSFDAVDGLSDLIGNVAEVTADHYDIYGVGAGGCWRQAARTDPLCRIAGATSMSVRGGGWLVARGGDDVGHVLYAAARLEIDAAEALDATGLRCVYPPR